MDLTASIAPKSDQLNADDLVAGPITVTIEKVSPGSDEQPVNVHLVERPGRPYKPSKSMRRVMVTAWGADTKPYAGQKLTLYRNPNTKFGRDVVGGIEISHMTGIGKRLTVALTVTRGKRAGFTVEPLTEHETTFTIPDLATKGEYRAHYQRRQRENAATEELDAIRRAADTKES